MQHWLNDVFSHPNPLGMAIIAAKTAVIYAFLVVGLRLLGKRELGQMTIYDLVLLIVLANSVQNAMVGDDTTLGGGIVSGFTLLALNRLLNVVICRSRQARRVLVGEPVLIISHGKLIEDRMAREGITKDQVKAALREHGIVNIEDVIAGVLEVDGSISIVPSDAIVHRTRQHYRALRLS